MKSEAVSDTDFCFVPCGCGLNRIQDTELIPLCDEELDKVNTVVSR